MRTSLTQIDYRKAAAAFTRLSEKQWARVTSSPFVRRVDAKRGKIVARRIRAKSSSSMMDMGEPKGHRRLPLYPDERTKALFMAYKSRK